MSKQEGATEQFNPFEGDPNTMTERLLKHIEAKFAEIDQEGEEKIAELRAQYLAEVREIKEQWEQQKAAHKAKMRELDQKDEELE